MDYVRKIPYKQILPVIIGSAGLCCVSPGANADVTFDGSVGKAGTLSGPEINIPDTMGTKVENNLFHSFSEFNVNTGQTVNFSGPDNIQNIFSRVTGSNLSSIDGIISSSIPGANLFLMNPNGIMFGPNAQINISGSFHATTADYISFGNQERFYANLNENTTLSVAAPSAFGFFDDPTGTITLNGSALGVQNGNTISMVGVNIALTDAASINSPDGDINIASTRSAGEFNIAADQTDLSQFEQLGVITLGNNSSINANGFEGGKIVIRGGELVLDNSTVSTNSDFGFLNESSLNIDIELSNELRVENYSQITSNTSSSSGSDAGDVNITSPSIVLDDHSGIESISDSAIGANSGNVTVMADTIQLSNYSSIRSNTTGTGNSGDITITTSHLDVKDASQISSASDLFFGFGGNAGNIYIDADFISLSGLSGASDPTYYDFTGLDASGSFFGGANGNINVHSNNIKLTNRAWIISDVYGELTGGDISIESDNLTITDGALISTTTYGFSQGGSISVNSENVTISGINIEPDPNYGFYYHSSISSDTWGTGDAGKITVTAENLGVLDGAIIVSYANLGGGDAGNIGINSENILVSGVNETIYNQALQDGKTIKFALDNARSTISSETLAFGGSGGDAGNISLTGENIAVIDGAWIQARATSDTLTATNSGDILIITSQLSLENGGSINSTIESAGNAGDIQIKSHSTNIIGTASEVDKTGIFSSTGEYSTGPGGDISIESALLTVEGGAEINAETSGAGRSGDINMIGTKLIVTGSNPATGARSKISAANASTESSIAAGDGGNINIESEEIEVNNSGLIFSGSTGTGASGNINIKKANKIYITNNGEISTMTLQADGGNITLESDSLLYQVDGTINTSVNGSMGDGGNIEISTNIYVLNNGQVIANAHEGSGGNISISANRLILDSNSIIDASSHLGIDGQVNIDLSGDNDINPEKLPDTKDDVAYKFTTLCSPYNSELSSLSVVDSLPANLSIGEFSASEYGSNMIFLNTKLAKPSASAVSFTTSERMQNFIRNSIALTNCD